MQSPHSNHKNPSGTPFAVSSPGPTYASNSELHLTWPLLILWICLYAQIFAYGIPVCGSLKRASSEVM